MHKGLYLYPTHTPNMQHAQHAWCNKMWITKQYFVVIIGKVSKKLICLLVKKLGNDLFIGQYDHSVYLNHKIK